MSAPDHAALAVNDRIKLAGFLRSCSDLLRVNAQVLTPREASTLAELIGTALRRGPVAMTPEMNEAMDTLLIGLADGLDGADESDGGAP